MAPGSRNLAVPAHFNEKLKTTLVINIVIVISVTIKKNHSSFCVMTLRVTSTSDTRQ